MNLKHILLVIFTSVNIFAQSVELDTFMNINKCDTIIKRSTHTVCFSYKYNSPIAVWYTLSGSNVDKVNLKHRPAFKKDPMLKPKYQIDPKLYSHNNQSIDLGHCAPDGAFDYDLDTLKKVYFTSNVTPQYHRLNAYYWSKSEQYSRYLAKKLGSINVIIIVLYNSNKILSKDGYISQAIPTDYIKVLYNNEQDVIHCFKFENTNDKLLYDKLIHHEIKCSKISLKHLLF